MTDVWRRLVGARWTRRRAPCQGGGTTDDGRSHGAAATGRATARAPAPPPDDVLAALAWLDGALARALATAETVFAVAPGVDPHRGLYVGDEEARRLLERSPGAPLLNDAADPDAAGLLPGLRARFDLSPFDAALVLLALAPDVDLRYERVYGYLQDDVTRRRPTVDLALNLLCSSAEARLARRVHLVPEAPLIRHGLLRLVPDPAQLQPPLLAHYLKLDEQIVRYLLDQASLDPRLAPFCELTEPAVRLAELPLSAEAKRALPALVAQARAARQPLRLYFDGPRGAGQRRAAEALA